MNQVTWTPGVSLEQMIKQAIEASMHFYKGNKTAVANSLGIAVRTLDGRLEKYEQEKVEHAERVDAAKFARAEFQARERVVPSNGQFDNAATPSANLDDARARAAASRNEQAAAKGDGLESPAHASPQQTVPVQKRKKV